jgi:hypothetical protein
MNLLRLFHRIKFHGSSKRELRFMRQAVESLPDSLYRIVRSVYCDNSDALDYRIETYQTDDDSIKELGHLFYKSLYKQIDDERKEFISGQKLTADQQLALNQLLAPGSG